MGGPKKKNPLNSSQEPPHISPQWLWFHASRLSLAPFFSRALEMHQGLSSMGLGLGFFVFVWFIVLVFFFFPLPGQSTRRGLEISSSLARRDFPWRTWNAQGGNKTMAFVRGPGRGLFKRIHQEMGSSGYSSAPAAPGKCRGELERPSATPETKPHGPAGVTLPGKRRDVAAASPNRSMHSWGRAVCKGCWVPFPGLPSLPPPRTPLPPGLEILCPFKAIAAATNRNWGPDSKVAGCHHQAFLQHPQHFLSPHPPTPSTRGSPDRGWA